MAAAFCLPEKAREKERGRQKEQKKRLHGLAEYMREGGACMQLQVVDAILSLAASE